MSTSYLIPTEPLFDDPTTIPKNHVLQSSLEPRPFTPDAGSPGDEPVSSPPSPSSLESGAQPLADYYSDAFGHLFRSIREGPDVIKSLKEQLDRDSGEWKDGEGGSSTVEAKLNTRKQNPFSSLAKRLREQREREQRLDKREDGEGGSSIVEVKPNTRNPSPLDSYFKIIQQGRREREQRLSKREDGGRGLSIFGESTPALMPAPEVAIPEPEESPLHSPEQLASPIEFPSDVDVISDKPDEMTTVPSPAERGVPNEPPAIVTTSEPIPINTITSKRSSGSSSALSIADSMELYRPHSISRKASRNTLASSAGWSSSDGFPDIDVPIIHTTTPPAEIIQMPEAGSLEDEGLQKDALSENLDVSPEEPALVARPITTIPEPEPSQATPTIDRQSLESPSQSTPPNAAVVGSLSPEETQDLTSSGTGTKDELVKPPVLAEEPAGSPVAGQDGSARYRASEESEPKSPQETSSDTPPPEPLEIPNPRIKATGDLTKGTTGERYLYRSVRPSTPELDPTAESRSDITMEESDSDADSETDSEIDSEPEVETGSDSKAQAGVEAGVDKSVVTREPEKKAEMRVEARAERGLEAKVEVSGVLANNGHEDQKLPQDDSCCCCCCC